jgi:L-threonylcarbamoyladenylate synthase
MNASNETTETARAAEILRSGGVVVFPTETVYGLGADASNPAAVRRVFAIKGRPATNPLIVHVADAVAARGCVSEWPEAAQRLADRFWPGPLTIVLPKGAGIVDEVTAGGPTVGVRVPDHPLALEMLRDFARVKEVRGSGTLGSRGDAAIYGVAAPSANRSNHVSPTRAQHVRDDLGDAVDMVLDGGPCGVGIESTVLSLASPVPTVLRPGGVSVEELADVLGEIRVPGGSDSGAASSPGRQERHYSPSVRTALLSPENLTPLLQDVGALGGLGVAVLAMKGSAAVDHLRRVDALLLKVMPPTPEEYAERLYATLRNVEAQAVESIWIEVPPDQPQWRAVRDRILRAVHVGND